MHRLARLAGFGVIVTPRAPFRLDREGAVAGRAEQSLERTPGEARGGQDPKR